ncbi:hypothetical protein Neosp_015081 [[Neocosmospora] mangrovei]
MSIKNVVISLLWVGLQSTQVNACGGGVYTGVNKRSLDLTKRENGGFTGCVTPSPLTCEVLGTCVYGNHTQDSWSVKDNIRQMQLADDAYNNQDFSRFNHREDTVVYMPGELKFDMAQHVQGMLVDFAAFPLQQVDNHPYPLSIGEGDWTVALTGVSGTNIGPIRGPSGWRSGTGRDINYEVCTFAKWEGGRITREHLWMDTITLNRQLGFLPSPVSSAPTISLSISDYTLPLSSNPDQDPSSENKSLFRQIESSFNQGNFDSDSLKLSPNVTIFTSRDDGPSGLSSAKFQERIDQWTTALSGLKLTTEVLIGHGDWTASISRLQGTLQGSLRVPEYISISPIRGNGTFDVWCYTIARWQGGLITHLKLMTDPLTIIEQLEEN